MTSPNSRQSPVGWQEADSQASTRQGSRADILDVNEKSKAHSPERDETKYETAADWSGPDDPGNPQNWSEWKKAYNVCCVSFVALVATFASSVYTPAVDAVTSDLNVNYETALVPFTIYVLGLGFGAPFASPLSETFGRRLVYVLTIPIFGLFILGSGFSKNIVSLCFCRFFAGVFAAPTLSVGSATLSDMYPASKRGIPMSLYINTPFLGPSLGPIIGAAAVVNKDWRWTEWTILFFIVAGLVPCCFMHETYKKILLQKRAKKYGLQDGPAGIADGKSWMEVTMTFVRSTLTRPLQMFFTEPVVFAFTMYISFNFCLVYSFFEAFSWTWQTYYEFSLIQVGLTFLGIGVGCSVACGLMIAYDQVYYQKLQRNAQEASDQSSIEEGRSKSTAKLAPEQRLGMAMGGGIMMVVGLFWFGWCANYRVAWISPVIAEALFGCGNQLTFMSATLYTMDFYGPLYGASAMAANTLLRYIAGFAVPMFSVQMFKGMGVGWACTLLGFLSAIGACIPFILFKIGPKLRQTSHYTHGN